jgi:hypothetical protein
MKGRIKLAAILAIFLALSFFFYLSFAENFVNSSQNSETDENLGEQTDATNFGFSGQDQQQSVDRLEESQTDEDLNEQTTITNPEQSVETSTTLPELSQINETVNAVESETTEASLPASSSENNQTTEIALKPKILLKLSVYKKKITRGEEFSLKVLINNEGNTGAKNVKVIVDLPNGFSTGSSEKACNVIEANSSCELEFFIKSDLSSTLGENEIKVRVIYE